MGNRISEKSIVDASMRWLKSLPNCKARKRKGGMVNAGEPDIEGCICGLHFEIECKAPGNKPTPNQTAKMGQWRNACAIVGVSMSLDDTKKIIWDGLVSAWDKSEANKILIASFIKSKGEECQDNEVGSLK